MDFDIAGVLRTVDLSIFKCTYVGRWIKSSIRVIESWYLVFEEQRWKLFKFQETTLACAVVLGYYM